MRSEAAKVAPPERFDIGLRCLWVARDIPYPLDTGAKVYSAKLAESLAGEGASVRFLGLGTTDAVPRDVPNMEWLGVPGSRGNELKALFSTLPNGAAIDATRAYKRLLIRQLREHWDAIVMDTYGAGWALRHCLRGTAGATRRPVLVHVSHNDEEAVWHGMSRQQGVSLPLRLAAWQNYLKVRALERQLLRTVDLFTAITDEDRVALSARTRSVPALTLTPGYAGESVGPRTLTAATPRRVILVGSFHWVIKQENLRRFLELADPLFERAGIGIDIVGLVPDGLRAQLQQRCRVTRFHGFVDDMAPLLDQARMAVVPEVMGGGFKLKFLDYFFARLPVATLTQAAAGLPDSLRAQTLVGTDLPQLIQLMIVHMDELELLNRMQRRAALLAAELFRWQDRGRQLGQAIAQLRCHRGTAS